MSNKLTVGNVDQLVATWKKDDTFKKLSTIESERLEQAVKLRRAREAAHLTQQELADRAGKPQSTIARIERGNMAPTTDTLVALATAMGKTLQIEFV